MVTPIKSKGKIIGYVDSRIGGRNENQDSAGIKETKLGTLVVVCDGMGGMQGGSVASQIAVREILESIDSCEISENPSMALLKAIRIANEKVIEMGMSTDNLRGMGTTVTALLITPRLAFTAYVGDSRIYQLRKGRKVFRTFDHSMVFEMVKKKVISEEQARLSEQSNVILRALGIKNDVEITVTERPYLKGDKFVLCTDGFWGAMPEEEFIRHLSEKKPIDKVLESTANVVESIGRSSGKEYDNLTAAILEMDRNSIIKDKMSIIAKKIILVLSLLLLVSVTANIYLLKDNNSTKDIEYVDQLQNINKNDSTVTKKIVPNIKKTGSKNSDNKEMDNKKSDPNKSNVNKTNNKINNKTAAKNDKLI